ncbi:MAG: hypothetical protein CVU18_11325 [Betaproteobacteria bacterium HGW-Betaproteobacteria-12]|nr:MAG: hypothetical protein CVU18_11325 [Betaproteobacteria bacterium HGW-Betaproteobacteria-12]
MQQSQGTADLVKGSQHALRTIRQGQRFIDFAAKNLESGLLGGWLLADGGGKLSTVKYAYSMSTVGINMMGHLPGGQDYPFHSFNLESVVPQKHLLRGIGRHLSWEGRESAESVRDAVGWDKTKMRAAAAGGFTADCLKDWVKGFLEKQSTDTAGIAP